jgi:hypothetical protein
MADKIEATDPHTVVIHLKFTTGAFLPALADPYNWIYQKKVLDKDIHWYEDNILGSGPFKFAGYASGLSDAEHTKQLRRAVVAGTVGTVIKALRARRAPGLREAVFPAF